MRNNLIPTPILDKNGKATTVHRKSASAGKVPATLAAAAPMIALSPTDQKKSAKKSKVTWTIGNIGGVWRNDEFRPDSFISRAGLAEEVLAATGTGEASATVPVALLFDYLRLGISPQEAAALETVSSLEKLSADERFTSALPGKHGRIQRSDGPDQIVTITGAVDRMEAAGMGPRKAAALLENGLTDDAFGRALEDEEVLDLFSRFKRQSSKVGAETNAAATVNAILDGLIPLRVADKDLAIQRASITEVMDALYPTRRRSRFRSEDELGDIDRKWILEDPDRIVALAAAASSHSDPSGSHGVLPFAVSAIRKHGAEACIAHSVELLCATRSDGTEFGPEGAEVTEQFIAEFLKVGGSAIRLRGGHGTFPVADPAGRWSRMSHTIDFADVLDLRTAGGTTGWIAEMVAKGYSIPQIRAVIADGISAVLADGAL